MKKGSFLRLLSVVTFTMLFNISSQAELAEMPLAEDATIEEIYQSEDDTTCIDDEGNEVACDAEADDVSDEQV